MNTRQRRAGAFIHKLSTGAEAFRRPGVLELKESNFRMLGFGEEISRGANSSLSGEPLQSSRTQPKCHNHHDVFVPVFRGVEAMRPTKSSVARTWRLHPN
jgi:hypothetical protein